MNERWQEIIRRFAECSEQGYDLNEAIEILLEEGYTVDEINFAYNIIKELIEWEEVEFFGEPSSGAVRVPSPDEEEVIGKEDIRLWWGMFVSGIFKPPELDDILTMTYELKARGIEKSILEVATEVAGEQKVSEFKRWFFGGEKPHCS